MRIKEGSQAITSSQLAAPGVHLLSYMKNLPLQFI